MNQQPTSTDRYSKAIKQLYKLLHAREADGKANSYTQEHVNDYASECRGIKYAIDHLHKCRIAEKKIV
jgi:hypothetical protein